MSRVLYDFFSLTFHQRERLGTSFISICRLNIITNSVFGRYRRGLFFLLHFAKQTLKFSLPQNKLHIFKQKLTRSKGEEEKNATHPLVVQFFLQWCFVCLNCFSGFYYLANANVSFSVFGFIDTIN